MRGGVCLTLAYTQGSRTARACAQLSEQHTQFRFAHRPLHAEADAFGPAAFTRAAAGHSNLVCALADDCGVPRGTPPQPVDLEAARAFLRAPSPGADALRLYSCACKVVEQALGRLPVVVTVRCLWPRRWIQLRFGRSIYWPNTMLVSDPASSDTPVES